MSLKRRTRLLTFRVSEEEYQDLKALLASQSARSLSEFVRTYMLRLSRVYDDPWSAAISPQFWRIEQRLADLDQSVKTLLSKSGGTGGNGDDGET